MEGLSAVLQVPALPGTCASAKPGARQRSRSSGPSAGWMRRCSGGAADSAGRSRGLCSAPLAAEPCGAAEKDPGSSGRQTASAAQRLVPGWEQSRNA